jgi:hypothetical protein
MQFVTFRLLSWKWKKPKALEGFGLWLSAVVEKWLTIVDAGGHQR